MIDLLEIAYWVVEVRTLSGEKIQTMTYYDNCYVDDYGVIKWHEYHQECRTQKAQIKKELTPIAWHPNRY